MSESIEQRMEKTVANFAAELARVRTGRAHPSLLENLQASCYGSKMPLSQLATLSAADASTLIVAPWDKNNIAEVEKAIRESDLGVNPAVEGDRVRVPLPPPSEERRRELAKTLGRAAENARVAARNIRREAVGEVKEELKEKTIGEDEGRRRENEIQRATDDAIARIDKALTDKQAELMSF